MLPWAVRELGGGTVVGSTRYHDIVAAIDRVEIGYTWYARRWQRTHVNAACKLLLMRHAFETLGCAVVGLRTDILNERSQRAIEERLGCGKPSQPFPQRLNRRISRGEQGRLSDQPSDLRDRRCGFTVCALQLVECTRR